MDKAKFTSHLILLSEIKKSVSKDMGKDITVLRVILHTQPKHKSFNGNNL